MLSAYDILLPFQLLPPTCANCQLGCAAVVVVVKGVKVFAVVRTGTFVGIELVSKSSVYFSKSRFLSDANSNLGSLHELLLIRKIC